MTWVLMPSGAEVDLLQPDPQTFQLRDILDGLCFLTRFSGAAGQYTVADHVLGCLDYATERNWPAAARAACLVHDFHEAYFGDVTSPVKQLIGAELVAAAEDVIAHALRQWLAPHAGLPVYRAKVKQADLALLLAERDRHLPKPRTPWYCEALVTDPHRTPLRSHTTRVHLVTAMHALGRDILWGAQCSRQLQDLVDEERALRGPNG